MQTNPLCLHCDSHDAAHPTPCQLCDECYAIAVGSIDDGEAERLAFDGVYCDAETAFESLVATRIDAMLTGERHLDGERVVYS